MQWRIICTDGRGRTTFSSKILYTVGVLICESRQSRSQLSAYLQPCLYLVSLATIHSFSSRCSTLGRLASLERLPKVSSSRSWSFFRHSESSSFNFDCCFCSPLSNPEQAILARRIASILVFLVEPYCVKKSENMCKFLALQPVLSLVQAIGYRDSGNAITLNESCLSQMPGGNEQHCVCQQHCSFWSVEKHHTFPPCSA